MVPDLNPQPHSALIVNHQPSPRKPLRCEIAKRSVTEGKGRRDKPGGGDRGGAGENEGTRWKRERREEAEVAKTSKMRWRVQCADPSDGCVATTQGEKTEEWKERGQHAQVGTEAGRPESCPRATYFSSPVPRSAARPRPLETGEQRRETKQEE